jgi:hypothetical protein
MTFKKKSKKASVNWRQFTGNLTSIDVNWRQCYNKNTLTVASKLNFEKKLSVPM